MTRPVQHSRTGGRRLAARVPARKRFGFWFGLFALFIFLGAVAGSAYLTFTTPGGLLVALRIQPSPTPKVTKTPQAPVKPMDLNLWSITSPRSYWVVIDKLRPIRPQSWIPKDLVTVNVERTFDMQMRRVPAQWLRAMFIAYHQETGRGLKALSGYRSYATQKAGFDGNYTLSAMPGYSEHQSGMAMDIGATSGKCPVYDCFADEPEAKWMAVNAWKYGFIVRYPKGKEHITGYQYEPWHFRFVGLNLAKRMHDKGIQTLEEEFGLPPAPFYAFQQAPQVNPPLLRLPIVVSDTAQVASPVTN